MAARVSKFPYPIHVNIGNFVTIKLVENNFLLWQAQLCRFLKSQELDGFINGEITAPSQTVCVEVEGREIEAQNKDYVDWLRTDRLISSWIKGAVSESILGLIIRLETSFEVWHTLCNRFSQRLVAREFELRGKLQSCRKHDRSLYDYLKEYKLICDQLSAIGKSVDEITKVYGVLEGLSSDYETFITTIYCLKPQPDYDEVISQLERFEARLQNYAMNQFHPSLAFYGKRTTERGVSRLYEGKLEDDEKLGHNNDRNVSEYAFVNQREVSRMYEDRKGRGFRGRGYGRGSTLNYQGRNQGYGPYQETQIAQQQSFPSSSNGFRPYANSSPRYQEVKTYPSSEDKNFRRENIADGVRVACQICKKPGHEALRCWYRFDYSFQNEEIPKALAAIHLEDSKGSEWYPESGATAHITANLGTIHNSTTYRGSDHYYPVGSSMQEMDGSLGLAALLVGEDPTRSYALICGNCRMHNGLGRKEDFPYITYYCPHCRALNRPGQSEELVSGSTPPDTGSLRMESGGDTIDNAAGSVSDAWP